MHRICMSLCSYKMCIRDRVISMAKIAKQLTELIGHTPLLELTNYEKALGLEAKIIAKLEYFLSLIHI